MIYYDQDTLIKDKKQILIVFISSTCSICHRFLKTIEAEEMPIDVLILNENSGLKLGRQLLITKAPTTVFYANNQEQDRFYGHKTIEQIHEFINNN